MTIRTCRDCGRRGDETPDDPAPGLCPRCYKARLDRITLQLIAEVAKCADTDAGDITPAIVWLAKALEEIGGETREHARKHANYLGHMLVLQSRQN